ncbi:MAG: lysophospholipid acyltransferase family protein [Cryobacterium sp.]
MTTPAAAPEHSGPDETVPPATARARPEPIYSTAIAAGRALFGVLRVTPEAHGAQYLPVQGGAVLAITHFGYLDFALVEWLMWRKNRRHIRFLAKKGAFRQPLIGALMRGMGHISVDMNAGAQAYGAAVTALRAGEILGVFPEGGVNASFTVRSLKSGAVRMASEAGVPVIPVAVWGGHRLLTKNHKPSFRDAYHRPVRFLVGEPIGVAPGADTAAVTEHLHRRLQALVDRLQADYPDSGTAQWWQPAHLGGTAPTPEQAAATEAERKARRAAAETGRADSA